MTREILFRGKRLRDGEWCYGFYVHLRDFNGNERHRIYEEKSESEIEDGENRTFYPDSFDVDPNTIGQFTGCEDRNGKKLFEGDIVKLWEEKPVQIGMVVFDHSFWTILNKTGYTIVGLYIKPQEEIIGNIYDNPDLAKEYCYA